MIEIIPNWHPMFVHFTVALLFTATALFAVGILLPAFQYKAQALIVARWNLLLGSAITIATLLAGWHAYATVAHDTLSHAAMIDHYTWALVTASVFFMLSIWQIKFRLPKRISGAFFTFVLIGSVLLVITAYKGGELVYRYGVGVMSLPQTGGAHQPSSDNKHYHADHPHLNPKEAQQY